MPEGRKSFAPRRPCEGNQVMVKVRWLVVGWLKFKNRYLDLAENDVYIYGLFFCNWIHIL